MFRINFPSKDEITQVLVNNLVGSDKRIDDLRNQWFMKHLIIALREAIYMLVVLSKTIYDNLTVITATGEKLEELGEEEGIYSKKATKAVHSVTLKKSSLVEIDYIVPDGFLLTTIPINSDPPIQFRVKSGQNKKILAGQSSVTGVIVECTEVGTIGNVSEGSISLVAQAGFDEVSDSITIEYGTDVEKEESYRQRILDKKRKRYGGGTSQDYKILVESVEGVVSATVFPRNRGKGTVDILINGVNGFPTIDLITKVQKFIKLYIPADLEESSILITGGERTPIAIALSNCTWINGYNSLDGAPIIQKALEDYINIKANKERIISFVEIVTIAKTTYLESDVNKKPILGDFTIVSPTFNIPLIGMQTAVVESIMIS